MHQMSNETPAAALLSHRSFDEPEVGPSVAQQYYLLPDGRQIMIEPDRPEEARAQLPGQVIGDFVVDDELAPADTANDYLYLKMAEFQQEFPPQQNFEARRAPVNKPFMDPSGIMNPASRAPDAGYRSPPFRPAAQRRPTHVDGVFGSCC